MKIVELNENGFSYRLHYSDSNKYLTGNLKTNRISWDFQGDDVSLDITYGTLQRQIVSPDGNYLILIFNGNDKFPDPCNCVIYNRKGNIHAIICAPNMVSNEVKNYHKWQDEVPGVIRGAIVKELKGKEELVLVVEDKKEYGNTGVHYTEHRLFDPVTGTIGELILWQLPLR